MRTHNSRTRQRRFLLLALTLALLMAGGCAMQLSTEEIRQCIATEDYDTLGQGLEISYEENPVMVNALNLARFYQFQGNWAESTKYFDAASLLLEEYEQRAIVSLRTVSGNIGTLTLSRGSEDYFGTGYERSLLHTFNSLNYLMQNNFDGAAVETRRMSLRQELWLEETEHRLRERLEEERERAAEGQDNAGYSAANAPAGYSMGEILRDPALRSLASSYQDPFSYSLSAIVLRIAGDAERARVNLSRAAQLDDRAYKIFREAWQRPAYAGLDEAAKAKRWEPQVPPLPRAYREGAANNPPSQELVFIFMGGLAPAMKMEQTRIPYPGIGYIMIDLPSYEPPVEPVVPAINLSSGKLSAYPLLRTDLLAYRHLRDEFDFEMGAAISRAITRAAVSVGGQALASSNNNTQNAGPLIGLLLTLVMDAYATADGEYVRNWELLPARGYLGLTEVPRGSVITLTFAGTEYKVELPKEARGVIVLVSQVATSNLKVDYVAY